MRRVLFFHVEKPEKITLFIFFVTRLVSIFWMDAQSLGVLMCAILFY